MAKAGEGGGWIVAGLPAQPTFVAIEQKNLLYECLKLYMRLGSICSQHDAKKCQNSAYKENNKKYFISTR